jgi:ADP-ribosylglycohydrolase
VVRDFLNVCVNQNSQVTHASVRKMEHCAIVGAIALDHVIANDF